MLFDLRSKGRRRTVQFVYLGLALLMGGGLIFFGVGAGNGNGGLLNAFTNNGSGNNQKAVVSSQEKAALKATAANPSSPAAWSSLVVARWTSASQAPDFNSTTGQFTTGGKKELAGAISAWQSYLKVLGSGTPDFNTAILAARAFGASANYAGEATAWEDVTLTNPTDAKGFECLAVSAYAAGQSRKGDLAAAQAETLVAKAQQFELKQQLKQAKSSGASSLAQAC